MKLFAGMDSESELGSDMEEEALVVTRSVDVDKLSIEERIELVQKVQQSSGKSAFGIHNVLLTASSYIKVHS